ncbi:Phosphoenolpyruvate-protein phosphotransferase (Enzyme I) [Desulfatibacillum aliphaticivorans]|uniref:Phosphoenolpyruvate-protein phosphotransferase n=1 Tax=Desulfatibacillum aliphaticivorans TaxID=218208 RepID=B8FEW3_DESAL|nr:phosphoenolpyruvate--protein phosphotransferase [Desulfatibacillum aliphaticivorans]ACL03640.1 Phosphoenolpyruvate-protein phosphotransferase (Enzyme I) [Desulfatibacillum aliphaticivorans]
MPESEKKQITLHGIPAAPGICIGQAYLVGTNSMEVVRKYPVRKEDVTEESARMRQAVKKSETEISLLIKKMQQDNSQQSFILESHLAVLKDKMFFGSTIETIEQQQVNAEWALKITVDRLTHNFNKIEDEYLRDRSSDIFHVYERVMRNLVGNDDKGIDTIHKRVILVAPDLSPAEASQIRVEWVQGFVTDRGGRTSHTGIVARTLQLPAVLGLGNATTQIHTEDVIIVDGIAGLVIVNPDENTLVDYSEAEARYENHLFEISKFSHEPATSLDKRTTEVSANIELLEEVVSVKDKGADGIGLYRTEFLYMNRRALPTEEELFENYKEAVDLMEGKPVTIRTLDVAGEKVAKGLMAPHEDNPALGQRAIRFCMRHPGILRTQLRAILRAASHGKIRLLFPMISSVEEILAVNQIVREVRQDLESHHVEFGRDVETGMMIEVPSAAVCADLFTPHVDFFSIGTNDLIQYSLAVDRGNKNVAHLFQPLHPAVLRMVKRVSETARDAGIRMAMCGEMAADPLHIPLLMGMDFDEFSMNPQAVPVVKSVVRSLDHGQCQALLEEALKLPTADEIADLITGTYGDLVFQHPLYAQDAPQDQPE